MHLESQSAEQVLHAAVESSDAFMYVGPSHTPILPHSVAVMSQALIIVAPIHTSRIFEITHRTLGALLNVTLIILSPLLTTLYDWWWSPMHLFFTYVIPLVPLFYMVDGYVSCLRGRTPDETWRLLTRKSGLTVEEWETKYGWTLSSGQQLVIPPFGKLYWCCAVKKEEPE